MLLNHPRVAFLAVRRLLILCVAIPLTMCFVGVLLTTPANEARGVLLNATPSEPIGLYVWTSAPPQTGRLAAFPAPPTAFPYADAHLSYLRRVPLLKRLAAGPGDRVCTTTDTLVINGQARGVIAQQDEEGRGLPHWRACRLLGREEFFALSDLSVKNGFDSRYFGPVRRRSLLGVFTPLFLVPEHQ